MSPKNKVISYKLAKKIWEVAKKKGIELPEGEWWWEKFGKGKVGLIRVAGLSKEGLNVCYPAYDTTELLEMIETEKDKWLKPHAKISLKPKKCKHDLEFVEDVIKSDKLTESIFACRKCGKTYRVIYRLEKEVVYKGKGGKTELWVVQRTEKWD